VTSNPLDDPFYYLNNFVQVLGWLEQRYADVLSSSFSTSANYRESPKGCSCEW
jgi:hypothetical protein